MDCPTSENKPSEVAPGPGSDAESTVAAPPHALDPATLPLSNFTACLQCLGAFFLFFNSWGVVNAFGKSPSNGY